eukprot:sb/3460520/
MGEDSRTTTVFVGLPPKFIRKPESVVSPEPKDVQLVCIAGGLPAPDITWYYNGEKIPVTSSTYTSTPTHTLSFRLTTATSGSYSCVASNTYGAIVTHASATIQEAEVIGVIGNVIYRQPKGRGCSAVNSNAEYVDLAVSGGSIILVGSDNELYRMDSYDSLPVHIHDSCCVKRVVVVGDRVYGLTPFNWLVSWHPDFDSWIVHMLGTPVQDIRSDGSTLYISIDNGSTFIKCNGKLECTKTGDSIPDRVNRVVSSVLEYSTSTATWTATSENTVSMVSIATSSNGKIYATLDQHCCFTAVEIDCNGWVWVLKNGMTFRISGDSLELFGSSATRLSDFSTYGTGFIGITDEGLMVRSESTEIVQWEKVEATPAALKSVDSYEHHGVLGVFNTGLKTRDTLSGEWTYFSPMCGRGLTDATEIVSTSYCSGKAPIVKIDVVVNPSVGGNGDIIFPFTSSADTPIRLGSDVIVVCHVTYSGHEPLVSLNFQGVILPTKQFTQDTTTIRIVHYKQSVTFVDEGTFKCSADDGDFSAEDQTTLDIYDKLKIVAQPESAETYLGGNLDLAIVVHSFKPSSLSYKWYKINDPTERGSIKTKDSTGGEDIVLEDELVDTSDIHMSIQNGSLHVHDLQANHEGSYYCVISNGDNGDVITTRVATITAIVPKYISSDGEGKMWVTEDLKQFYPIWYTSGVLDIAVHNDMVFVVLSDYKVYKLTTGGIFEEIPNSCCVDHIAVYTDLGTPRLVASHIWSFELLHRRIDGQEWSKSTSTKEITSVSVVGDEILARVRGPNQVTVVKTDVDGQWADLNVTLSYTHIAGLVLELYGTKYYNGKVYGIGDDRALYLANEYNANWEIQLEFLDVECGTIDNNNRYLYLMFTNGTLARYPLSGGVQDRKIIYEPRYNPIHVSWEGTMFYTDNQGKLFYSRALASYPVPYPKMSTALGVTTLEDKTILVLNKQGLFNVTGDRAEKIRDLPADITSMALVEGTLYFVTPTTLYALDAADLKSGNLMPTDPTLSRLFSITGQLTGVSKYQRAVIETVDGKTTWTDTGMEHIVSIPVLRIKPLKFTEVPENSVLEKGKQFILPCTATGIPEPTITWYKNQIEVSKERSKVIPLATGGLLIPSAELSHQGMYSCVATNTRGERISTAAVIFVKESLEFTETPDTKITVPEGQELRLPCKADGYPEPELSWMNEDGSEVRESSSVVILADGTLVLSPSDDSHSGSYVCEATNAYDTINTTTTVTVKAPTVPVITIPPVDQTVFIGRVVTVSCTATGGPTTQIYMLKNNKPVSDVDVNRGRDGTLTAELVLSITDPADTATYTCVVYNADGQDSADAKITVYQPVKVAVKPKNSTIYNPDGTGMVVLSCNATGAPDPTVTWINHFKKELEGGTKYTMATLDTIHTLTIKNFNKDDAGSYTCKATNVISTETDMGIVNAQVPVGFGPWSACNATCGAGVKSRKEICKDVLSARTTECIATKNTQTEKCMMPACPTKPSVDEWGTNIEKPIKGDTLILSCEVYYLQVKNLTVSDRGEYKCTAYNHDGEDNANIDVEVNLSWSPWSDWGPCSKECDGGTKSRIRACENRDTSFCEGDPTNTKSCNTFLCDRSSPEILDPIEDKVAAVGTCVTFSCQIGSVPPPEITWWSGEGVLKPLDGSNKKISFMEDGWTSLEICNITMADAECYNCLGVNSEGEGPLCGYIISGYRAVYCVARVMSGMALSRISNSKPSPPPGVNMTTGMLKVVAPPQITTPPTDQRVSEGAFVELKCETVGIPAPEVEWLYNGQTFAHQFVLQGDDNLRFTNISATQEGQYKCVAKNTAGTTFAEAEISVTLESEWSEWSEWSSCIPTCGLGNHTRVRVCTKSQMGGQGCEGEDTETALCYTKPCPVEGGYTAWSDWSVCSEECGGGDQSRTRTCTNPSPAHGGRACPEEVSTDKRTCNLQACPKAPVITKEPEDKAVDKGSEVTFSCSAEGVPTPRVMWFEDDISVSAMTTTSGAIMTSYLVIKDADKDRTFNCLAQNEAGAALASVELTVTKSLPTFITEAKDIKVPEDTDISVDCVVDDTSDAVWMFGGKPVSEHFRESLSLANGTLIIQDANRYGISMIWRARDPQFSSSPPPTIILTHKPFSRLHSGRYDCVATNDVGTADQSIFIDVERELVAILPAKNPSLPAPVIHGKYGEWTPWGNCSVSCGEGTRSRKRECDSPAPSTYGLPCSGADTQKEKCEITDCDGRSKIRVSLA